MYPATALLHHTSNSSKGATPIDIDALSGILGSISIACWVVVFTPQIVENFRRSSAEGLSLLFVIIWLAGDVFNILGAVLQGVLPTMTVLAVYYTLADIVLLGQCVWYRGWRFGGRELVKAHGTREVGEDGEEEGRMEEEEEEAVEVAPATEESPLLANGRRPRIADVDRPSRTSESSIRSSFSNNVDATRLSPATPFLPPPEPTSMPPAAETLKPRSACWAFLFNLTALIVVCLAGVLGWYLSSRAQYTPKQSPSHHHHSKQNQTYSHPAPPSLPLFATSTLLTTHSASTSGTNETLQFDLWGQIFGYLCAVLYLGSRIPQLLLNFQRKSTDGVSLLFFLFACVGNLTYVLSIFAYEPSCARVEGAGLITGASTENGCAGGEWRREYGRYILVNTSWLVGSAGTLLLDLCIFGQFWLYRGGKSQSAA